MCLPHPESSLLPLVYKAAQVAATSTFGKFRVGAILFDKRGRVISSGVNSRKSHPRQKGVDGRGETKIFLHAEISALVRARKTPYTIVVARVNKGGEIRLARPCLACWEASLEAGVERIVWSTGNEEVFDYFEL